MDQAVLTWFNQTIVHPGLDIVMTGSTLIGLFLFLASGIYYYHKVSRRFGQAIFLALFLALVAALLFQYLALRPRPDGVRLILAQPYTPSFPSGHVAVSFAAATVIVFYQCDWLTWLTALGIAILVSVSRLYLGHHYPSDIVGGILLGVGIGLPVYGLLLAPENGRLRWAWLLWPQVALVLLVTQMAYLGYLPGQFIGQPGVDKVMHFLLFGAVVFWLNLWLNGRRWHNGRWVFPLAIILPLSWAIFEEALQHFSPLRTVDLLDLASDLAGMVTFWWVSEQFLL